MTSLGTRVDNISSLVHQKLGDLIPIVREVCIFKVHHQLRKVNEKAYKPSMLAIGSYHHGKTDLAPMEEHKLRYLQSMLRRINESSVEKYIMALTELEVGARRCYQEVVSLTPDEFVEMMLLDGCFIIELFRKYDIENPSHEYDPIFQMSWMLEGLMQDLLLFENQLPFFVLAKLFDMTKVPTEHKDLISLTLEFFASTGQYSMNDVGTKFSQIQQIDHVRGQNSFHVFDSMSSQISRVDHLLSLIHIVVRPSFIEMRIARARSLRQQDRYFVPCATKLREFGVKFKKLERGNLFDITFNNGIIEIPQLKIVDDTESFLRNLIAYEQYRPLGFAYVSDYVHFMDCLINSSRDAELLRRSGIIVNYLGDDDVISNMFNRIGDNTIVPEIYYVEVQENVKKHCSKRRNKWLAKLRHDYFNSPWALLSFLAAVFLLLLSLAQTIFSIP